MRMNESQSPPPVRRQRRNSSSKADTAAAFPPAAVPPPSPLAGARTSAPSHNPLLRRRKSRVNTSVPESPPQSDPGASATFITNHRLLSPRRPLITVAPYLDEPDTPFKWLYQPHTVSGLLIAFAAVLYFTFWLPDADDELEARARALKLCSVVFLVYCSIMLRDSLLLRPHPVVWRVVHGAGLLYLFGLAVLLAFSVTEGRLLLRTFDASLGPRPAENDRLYAQDCRVFTPGDSNGPFARVKECVFDIFVIAHTVGWAAKALLLRDWRLGWLLSILWEFLELTFQGILPNFRECWWDHWVVDVALSNGGGLIAGMWLVKKLEMKAFDWTGREKVAPIAPTPLAQLQRVLVHVLQPYEFSTYEWALVDNFQHLVGAVGLVLIMELIELNAFFMKYVLYIPPPCPLNVVRLVLWFALSLPATREYYSYVTDPRCKRMGPNMWLALILALFEVLIVVKYGRETAFPSGAHVPFEVTLCWLIACSAFALWTLLRFLFPGAARPFATNSIVVIGAAALLYIGISQDTLMLPTVTLQMAAGGGGGASL